MSYRIQGLDPRPFQPLYGLADAELARHGARRYRADAAPGFPDRVELREAKPGETVLLLPFVHQTAATPYHASHAIYVREGAAEPFDEVGQVPEVLRPRTLSLRAFDGEHMMVDADLVEGQEVERLIERLLADERVAYLHAHFAKRGCYACRIERA